jgi:hypothetical protein
MKIPSQKICPCGSGNASTDYYDARGLFLTRACSKCRDRKLGYFRPEVLTDSNYECDEAIEED